MDKNSMKARADKLKTVSLGTQNLTRNAAIADKLCMKAVNSGDGFRQWVYPNLPKNYDLNPEMLKDIARFIKEGYCSDEIVHIIYLAKS